MTTFTSARPAFILRRARKSDARSSFDFQQDPVVKKGFMTVPTTLAEARHELLDREKDRDSFVIDVDGECVGTVNIHNIVPGHKATIGYWLAKKARGKGIMTKAVKIIVPYAFKKYRLYRIEGKVRTFNKASAHVLEAAGFKLEGIMRKSKFKDGKFLDDMMYAKVR